MARGVKYGKKFRTRAGKFGRYKYVRGRRVAFVTSGRSRRATRKNYNQYRGRYRRKGRY